MIVYIANAHYQPDEYVLGVFSTAEKAEQACARHDKESCFFYGYSVVSYEIDEELS